EEAEAILAEAYDKSKDPRILEMQAMVLWNRDPEYAGDRLGLALVHTPWSARLRQQSARLLEEMGRTEEALRMQAAAVEAHPADMTHLLKYAEMLLRTGRTDDGAEQVRRTRGLWYPSR